mgnify:CR=1 FL=1
MIVVLLLLTYTKKLMYITQYTALKTTKLSTIPTNPISEISVFILNKGLHLPCPLQFELVFTTSTAVLMKIVVHQVIDMASENLLV